MKTTVAIIDDDSNIRNLLFNYLKESEFNVIGEESGSGLIELFQSYKNKIDILVLDVVIPNIDKIKKFFQDTSGQNLCVILITGYNIKNLVKELSMINPNGKFILLKKPFSKQIFLETLRKY